MITKIDINSEEFKAERAKTENFVKTVQEKRGWVNHPNAEINESVIIGLTRNQVIYGTRYCPCFMVVGETKEERREHDNRICPCKPAVQKEIPEEGRCHCGIYCTPEHAESARIQESAEITAHEHSRGLTKEECEAILREREIDSDDLEALLEARKIGFVQFNLVDVREWNEWARKRIDGTDYIIPTTSFYESIAKLDDQKDTPTIVYCFSGSRSAQCQMAMKDLGFAQVANLDRGIMSWKGAVLRGE